ncbi:hypothetical protein SODALDRAFT_337848 [Sodiomyces alkalinus F11]|uniref:Uncharacterized protein n=1 Tax=Sodiomyces alkalinus (strain CBS 110278 / VKM F-3762 / F11) TaxID=1314773 RepID=A0A3N2PJC6_SODAK|nr:hypothetical protein SODALDRAFT_337848 [Sodiomyces alkalinus F11]ROT34633.1 hypothetical protein SODALDRAFT_337848 [Sodiomyces alkalinus F11]
MSSTGFDPPLPGSSFFNIYNDAEPARNPVDLPAGGCNFVDLTPGANGTKCGCRRFWSRFAAGRAYADNLGSDHSAWCMCSHHACYHDDDRAPETPTSARPTLGQENERPKVAREPLSPVVQEASFRLTTGLPDPLDFLNQDASRQGNLPSQQASSGLPDTLRWGGSVQQSQPANSALPPIPPQCLIASQISSTTSSQSRYLRPFAGRGLRTLSGVAQSNPRSPLQDKSQDIQAATTAAQQDAGGDHTMLEADDPPLSAANTPRGRPQDPIIEDRPASDIFGGPSRQTFQHLSDTVQGHEQRLDRLENVSFSAGGHDECHDKHDSTDLRVTDLEVRVEEVERLLNDTSSNGTARQVRRRPGADESTNSVVSVSTNATSRAAESSEVFSHLQSLQSQILQLRTYMPSYMHAWEVEVVFLPFPLRRIWQERYDFKTELTLHMDEWTQLPNTHSAASMRAQSPFCGDWAEAGRDHDWLLPKACGPRSIIDKRLRSRGLVRTISVKGPDARSVQAAIHAAFGDNLSDMSAAAPPPASRRRSVDGKIARFLGLQNPWVPLRKIHKDSRLRFLAPAEMVTPALWDATFLNSVVMRSSEPRLFITHPEAYLQDAHAFNSGWTWQKIRELSRVYPDSSHSAAALQVPEADALEDYWNWNEQLDEPASAQSSLNLRQARQRISLSPSQHFFTLKSSLRSPSPFVSRRQTPSVREPQVSRPLRIRTTSMPPSALKSFSPSIAKRRVASYGQQRNEGGSAQGHALSSPSAATALKRKRTRSPSRPRNTPRWTASPSPALAGFISDEWPPHHQARGVTPLYYATPFSNAPPTDARPRHNPAMGDGDTSDGHDEEDVDVGSTTPHHDHGDGMSHFDGDARARGMLVENSRDVLQPRQLQPEDEPWPGIEDLDHVSDGENIDPLFSPAAEDDDDATSVASSQPSEYPSTNRGWELPGADHDMDFDIHEDDDRS